MTQLPIVLQLPLTDEHSDSEFTLLHVSQDGSNPLDVKLVSVAAGAVFAISFKQSNIASLKSRNSKQSQEAWESTLSSILLDQVNEDDTSLLEGVEAVTEIVTSKKADSLHINIQKRIEGITQRLGQIILGESEEVVTFQDWCSLAIQSRNTYKAQAQAAKTDTTAKDSEITRLEEALAELSKLKEANETALLEKFSLLLNEKKLKIRDQQRLLATANVDQTKVQEMELETEEPARALRTKKRKANAAKTAGSDSDDAFEKMDVDKPSVSTTGRVGEDSEEDVSDQRDAQTASETESDSDVEMTGKNSSKPVSPPVTKSQASQQRLSQVKEKSPPSRRTRAATAEKESEPVRVEKVALPPRRELPFTNRKTVKKSSPLPAAKDGSETESDDEL